MIAARAPIAVLFHACLFRMCSPFPVFTPILSGL
jgi:hypothetical protein